jgi:hypothetical protein
VSGVGGDGEPVGSVRAARRFGWRVAGGRLVVGPDRLSFRPNALERLRPGSAWECPLGEVLDVVVHPRLPWIRVVTTGGEEGFRVRRRREVASMLARRGVPSGSIG